MIDMLDVMFRLNEVCVVKHHPLRDYNVPFFEKAFATLIQDGYLAQMTGGPKESSDLVNHPSVDHVHMTGGKPTHDGIVYGFDKTEQAKNKAAEKPVLKAEMTSELGCVTPWIVTPQPGWTDGDSLTPTPNLTLNLTLIMILSLMLPTDDVEHHVKQLVAGITSNNSCNCLAPKMLVIDKDWDKTEFFLSKLKFHLNTRALVAPYYPGTTQRYEAFKKAYPKQMEQIKGELGGPPDVAGAGKAMSEPCPWMVITLEEDVLDKKEWEYALRNEPFAPVFHIALLTGTGEEDAFLSKAVSFVNDELFGTLSMTLLAKDSTPAVEKAIADLRYGAIALNAWTAQCVSAPCATWGAYPGESLNDVQSGIGVVYNCLFYDHVQKSVLRSPFIEASHIGTAGIPSIHMARALVGLLTKPSLGAFVGLLTADVPRHKIMFAAGAAVMAVAILTRYTLFK